MEMYNTLTNLNDRKNTSLLNDKIQEAMRKAVEEKLLSNANNKTVDAFSHTSNTQAENSNKNFTSEKLDKSDDLSNALKDLTINDSKYYESDTATASDAQGDSTRNLKTVTHTSNGNEKVTSNGNEKVTDPSNKNFEQKLLSNLTLPVVFLTINLRIDPRIVTIVVAPQMLLTPNTM